MCNHRLDQNHDLCTVCNPAAFARALANESLRASPASLRGVEDAAAQCAMNQREFYDAVACAQERQRKAECDKIMAL